MTCPDRQFGMKGQKREPLTPIQARSHREGGRGEREREGHSQACLELSWGRKRGSGESVSVGSGSPVGLIGRFHAIRAPFGEV